MGKCEIFKSFRGSAPDPAGGLTAPPPPDPKLEKSRAVHGLSCFARLTVVLLKLSQSSYFGRTSFFFVAMALNKQADDIPCRGRSVVEHWAHLPWVSGSNTGAAEPGIGDFSVSVKALLPIFFFSFPFPFPFLTVLSLWKLNEISVVTVTEMWTTKAILLLINCVFFSDTPASIQSFLNDFAAIYGAGTPTKLNNLYVYFPSCAHRWENGSVQLLQLFNNSTGVVVAEKNASLFQYVTLDRNRYPFLSVTWSGDYICRFPSDMSMSTSSKPPFPVTILGKLVQTQFNVKLGCTEAVILVGVSI